MYQVLKHAIEPDWAPTLLFFDFVPMLNLPWTFLEFFICSWFSNRKVVESRKIERALAGEAFDPLTQPRAARFRYFQGKRKRPRQAANLGLPTKSSEQLAQEMLFFVTLVIFHHFRRHDQESVESVESARHGWFQ